MKRDLVIIEAPFNLGLKTKNEHHIPGVNKLPQWLQQFGFHDKLDTGKIIHINPPRSLAAKPGYLFGGLTLAGPNTS